MKLETPELGAVEIDPRTAVHLPQGLIGYESLTRFHLLLLPDYEPFLWLVCSQDPGLVLALAEPRHFIDEPYLVTLSEADTSVLDLREGDPLEVYVVISQDERTGHITGNLKGPVVINAKNRLAKQLLVYSAKHSARQPMHAVLDLSAEDYGHPTTVRIVGKRVA